MQYDTTLSTAQLDQLLDHVAPDWTLRDAEAVDAGLHAVARLTVETQTGEQTAYLKATPPEKEPTVCREARLLAGIESKSAVPVPPVVGVVDDHETLPTPAMVTLTMPGESIYRPDLPSVSDETLGRLARQSGRALATLHDIDTVEEFGFLTHTGPSLSGDRPADDFSTLAVADGNQSWRDTLDEWATGTLSRLEETRFDDVVPRARPVLERRIEQTDGPFEPVLARIDHSVENVLVADGQLQAFLDWEFTIAATPAYDLSCVVWSLAGGPYQFSPDAGDRRPLVRDALLDGYAAAHDGSVLEQYRANRACYELLSTLRSMVHLEDWFDSFELGDRVDDAAADIRTELDERL